MEDFIMARLPLIVPLDMQNQKITRVVDPTDPQDAATMAYVDANAGAIVSWQPDTFYSRGQILLRTAESTVDGQVVASAGGLFYSVRDHTSPATFTDNDAIVPIPLTEVEWTGKLYDNRGFYETGDLASVETEAGSGVYQYWIHSGVGLDGRVSATGIPATSAPGGSDNVWQAIPTIDELNNIVSRLENEIENLDPFAHLPHEDGYTYTADSGVAGIQPENTLTGNARTNTTEDFYNTLGLFLDFGGTVEDVPEGSTYYIFADGTSASGMPDLVIRRNDITPTNVTGGHVLSFNVVQGFPWLEQFLAHPRQAAALVT